MNKLNSSLQDAFKRASAAGHRAEPTLGRDDLERVKRYNLVWTKSRNSMYQMRCLTTEEREDVMGLPTGWCGGGALTTTQAAKLLGNAWHVPTIELLLTGLELPLRNLIDARQIGTRARPLKVLSFFDGIGSGWCALHKCLSAWGLEKIHVHYIAIENDPNCQKVLSMNFPADVKSEQGDADGGGRSGDNGQHYHLTQWGDIRTVSKQIQEGKHARFLQDVFLCLGGFPCNNLSGNNRAVGANGRTGLAGPQSSLFYAMDDILTKLGWTNSAAPLPVAGRDVQLH